MPTTPRTKVSGGVSLAHGYDPPRQLRLRRGLRPRVRRTALHLQRARLRRALRAGGAEARLRLPPPRRARGGGPRQPRRQRRDPRARVGSGRARQRLLARARRPQRPLARALAAPPRLPLRVAGSARQGGRARRALRARRPPLPLHPARPRRRAGRARARALLGPGRLPAPLSQAGYSASARAAAIASAPASPTSSSGRRIPLARRS